MIKVIHNTETDNFGSTFHVQNHNSVGSGGGDCDWWWWHDDNDDDDDEDEW